VTNQIITTEPKKREKSIHWGDYKGRPCHVGIYHLLVDFLRMENYNHNLELRALNMAQILSKISEIREKAAGAMEDVPDTLIGTVIALTLLTVAGLSILMVFGYLLTR